MEGKKLSEELYGYIHIVDVSPELGRRFREWTRKYGANRMSVALALLLDIAERNEMFNFLANRIEELEERIKNLEQNSAVDGVKTFGGGVLK